MTEKKRKKSKKARTAQKLALAKGQRSMLAAVNEKTNNTVLQESKREHIFIITTSQEKSFNFEYTIYNTTVVFTRRRERHIGFISL